LAKNNNSNYKEQMRIKNVRFLSDKKCSNVKSKTIIKKTWHEQQQRNLVKSKRFNWSIMVNQHLFAR
jgi:hypothetical protein